MPLRVPGLLRGRLRYKLFLCYTVPVLVVIAAFAVFSLLNSVELSRQNYIEYRSSLNRQVLAALEANVELLGRHSRMLYADSASLSTLMLGPSSPQYFAARRKIVDLCTMQLELSDKLDGIVILSTNGSLAFSWSRSGDSPNLYNSGEDDWFQEALRRGGRELIRAGHVNLFYYEPRSQVLSVSRALYDTTKQPIGVVVAFQSMSYIEALLEQAETAPAELLRLCDEQGRVIWSSLPEQAEILPTQQADRPLAYTEATVDGRAMLGTALEAPALGWRLEAYLPLDHMQDFSDMLQRSNLVMILLILLLSFVLSTFMAVYVTKPLGQFARSFRQVSEGNFDVPVDIRGNDELSIIGRSYNTMLRRTKTLIREKYELRLTNTQAQLEALQSQIRPHFLFNTLNSIKAVIDSGEPAQAARMVQSLSDLLRYCLGHGRNVVTFQEELEITRKYLFLQQCRFGDRYTVEYDVDQAVLPLSIPRLTLQPLVENAILHGLEPLSEKGRLLLTAKLLDGRYVVYVANTGRTIPEDKLRELNDKLSGAGEVNPLEQERLGIVNVNHRLKLHYGDAYGLRLFSTEQYTTARLELPVRRPAPPDPFSPERPSEEGNHP